MLAQFLYENKELNLTGIGRFIFKQAPDAYPESGKTQNTHAGIQIDFIFDKNAKEDPKLIEYISAQTGKMKSLAAADLDTHLELARQFLNIGNPFYFEGIGTLTKTKSRQFKFVQGPVLNEKIDQGDQDGNDHEKSTENDFSDYEEMFSPKKPKKFFGQKLILAFFILTGLGLAIWGGYYVYKNFSNENAEPEPIENVTVPVTDSTYMPKEDTRKITRDSAGFLNFIIEESGKERALARFDKLKSWGIDIKMDSKDSLRYKLYFQLNVLLADTARVRDSLALLYSNTGKVRIEPGQ